MRLQALDSLEPPIDPLDVDRAGRCVLSAIRASCESETNFPAKVGAALHAALSLGAAEPELVQGLFGAGDPRSAAPQERWRATFAAELRDLARKEAPSPPPLPPLAESFLVGAIGSQALCFVQGGEAERLEDLFPELLEFILGYYYADRAEARAAVTAVVAGR